MGWGPRWSNLLLKEQMHAGEKKIGAPTGLRAECDAGREKVTVAQTFSYPLCSLGFLWDKPWAFLSKLQEGHLTALFYTFLVGRSHVKRQDLTTNRELSSKSA